MGPRVLTRSVGSHGDPCPRIRQLQNLCGCLDSNRDGFVVLSGVMAKSSKEMGMILNDDLFIGQRAKNTSEHIWLVVWLPFFMGC